MSVTQFTLTCPLCQGENACGNELAKQVEQSLTGPNDQINTCWCQDVSIQFPPALLAQVPEQLKGKRCICQNCVKKFLNEQSKCAK